MAAPTRLVPARDLAIGDVLVDLLGQGHEIHHFELGDPPVFNPDPARAGRPLIAVARDGWRITIGSPQVPVLDRGGDH